MQDYASRLRSLVERSTPLLLELPEPATRSSPAPGKWCPREVIGHLIDSASNNHQRFVRARFTDDLVFPGYDQNAWVDAQQYRDAPWAALVELWRAFNLHLVRVMLATPESVRLRERAQHNLHEVAWKTIPADEPATLDVFMADYVGHVEHHLRQIPLADEVPGPPGRAPRR